MTKYTMKGKQSEFNYVCGLSSPEDYGISVLPSWDTTVFIVGKTSKGFKLGFGSPCPANGGWLDLTLSTPSTSSQKPNEHKSYVTTQKEPKMKLPIKKMKVGYNWHRRAASHDEAACHDGLGYWCTTPRTESNS